MRKLILLLIILYPFSVYSLEKTKEEKVAKYIIQNIQKDYVTCYSFYKVGAEVFKKAKKDKEIIKGLEKSADVTLKFNYDLGEVLSEFFNIGLNFKKALSSFKVEINEDALSGFLDIKAGKGIWREYLFESGTLGAIFNKDEIIYGTIGIHPHETTHNKITSDIIIKNFINNPKIIGIGETGLDFYYKNSDKEDQITSFKEHIEASIKTNCPLIIHSRDAE